MALVDQVRTADDALADFAAWTRDFNTIADPLRRAARVMAAMAQVMAGVIDVQSKAVQAIASRMSVINQVLQAVGNTLSNIKQNNLSETDRWRFGAGTEAEMTAIADMLKAEGISPDDFSVQAASDVPFDITANKEELTNIQSQLQIVLDSLSSTSQADQARVQTSLGRYNATFDLVSALLKKSEGEGVTVGNNLKS